MCPDHNERLARAVRELCAPAPPPGPQLPASEPGWRLRRLTEAGVEVLGAGAAGALIRDERGRVCDVAGTDEALGLVRMEIDTGDGPASRCLSSGRPLVIEDLCQGDPRWPRWVQAATDRGWRSASVVPLPLVGPPVGALMLLGRVCGEVTDLGWALSLAGVTAAGITHEHDQRQLSQLRDALRSRVIIEQAKGVLAERGGIDPDEAFHRMRRFARTHRLPLAEVARVVVDGSTGDAVLAHTVPPGPPASPKATFRGSPQP